MKRAKLIPFLVMFMIIGLPVMSQESGTTETDPAPAEIPEGEAEAEADQPAEEGRQIDYREYSSVDGLENWEHTIDVAGLKKGKYNVVIRGLDKAGNEYIEGPYNIYIDPDSDLPVVRISSPTPDMRVGNDFNIVGTCVDDDAVSRVEVKIDEGEFSIMQAFFL